MSNNIETIDAFGSEKEVPFQDMLSHKAYAIRYANNRYPPEYFDTLRADRKALIQKAISDHESWTKRERTSDRQIEQYRHSGHGNARLDLYIKFVDTLKHSHADDATKIQAVQAFFSEMQHYDAAKQQRDNQTDSTQTTPDHIQTTYETITSGRSVCGDITHAKCVTLIAVGVDPKHIRIVDGLVNYGPKKAAEAHEILMVHAAGRNYILNALSTDTMTTHDLPTQTGWAQSVYDVSTGNGYFVPIINHSATGTFAYTVTRGENGIGLLPVQAQRWKDINPEGRPFIEGQLGINPEATISINDRVKIKTVQQLMGLINEAHNLNPTRSGAPSPVVDTPTARSNSRPPMKGLAPAIPDSSPLPSSAPNSSSTTSLPATHIAKKTTPSLTAHSP